MKHNVRQQLHNPMYLIVPIVKWKAAKSNPRVPLWLCKMAWNAVLESCMLCTYVCSRGKLLAWFCSMTTKKVAYLVCRDLWHLYLQNELTLAITGYGLHMRHRHVHQLYSSSWHLQRFGIAQDSTSWQFFISVKKRSFIIFYWWTHVESWQTLTALARPGWGGSSCSGLWGSRCKALSIANLWCCTWLVKNLFSILRRRGWSENANCAGWFHWFHLYRLLI